MFTRGRGSSIQTFGVVSVYNDNPRELLKYFSAGYSIFDNSEAAEDALTGLGPVRVMNNPGHSLYNFFTYIIENYETLPPRIALIKSNIVPRHVELETDLANLLIQDAPQMLWSESNFRADPVSQMMDPPNLYKERNTSWYLRDGETKPKYFGSFEHFERFIFVNPSKKAWVKFSPGACYLLSDKNVLSAPKSVYEFLRFVSSYKFFPKEAFLVERILWSVFNADAKFHPRFRTGKWRRDLERITPVKVFIAHSISRIRALFVVLNNRPT
jgi:hypothetical protein